jgi:hypothetical protein
MHHEFHSGQAPEGASLISMSHQIDAAEWPSFDQKRRSLTSSGSPFFALTLPSLPQPRTGTSLTRLHWVSKHVFEKWSALDQKKRFCA